MMALHRFRSWMLYTLAFVLTSLAAGLVYGWPALRRELQAEGSLLSENQLGGIFTVGAWSTQGGRFFVGLARDRYGTRSVMCVCMVLVNLGCIGVALSDPNSAAALSAALFSVGLGSGVQLCTQPVAGLFPNHVGITLSSLSGAFQISGLVFLVLTSGSVSRQVAFLIFAGCLGLLTILAGIAFPKGGSFLLQKDSGALESHTIQHAISIDDDIELPVEKEENDVQDMTEPFSEPPSRSTGGSSFDGGSRDASSSTDCINQLESSSTSDKGRGEGEDKFVADLTSFDQAEQVKCIGDPGGGGDDTEINGNKEPLTALHQMKSAEYIGLCLWFCICLVPMQYYVGTIGFQLEEKGDENGFYTNLFAYTYAGSIITSPLSGWIADKYGLGVAQGMATFLVALSLFLLASNDVSLDVHSLGLVAYGVGRLSVFGMYFTNVGKRLGYANYGTLAGFGLLASAIVSLLQYPLISLSSDGHAAIVNIVLGIVLVAQLPYFIWLHRIEQAS